jgi:hypothetical protein
LAFEHFFFVPLFHLQFKLCEVLYISNLQLTFANMAVAIKNYNSIFDNLHDDKLTTEAIDNDPSLLDATKDEYQQVDIVIST